MRGVPVAVAAPDLAISTLPDQFNLFSSCGVRTCFECFSLGVAPAVGTVRPFASHDPVVAVCGHPDVRLLAHDQRLRPRGGSAPTFAQAPERVTAIHGENWRDGGRSVEVWRSSLERFAYPHIGAKSVAELTTGDVMSVVAPIWSDKAERRNGCASASP